MGYSPVIKRSKLSIHTKTWSKKTNYSSPEASLIESFGEESSCNEGELDSIPGSGRSPGEGNGNPL